MQKIVMRDGVAMLIEEITHDIVDLEEFRRAISMNHIETPLLPFGCVFYAEKAGHQTFCIMRLAEIREMDQANVKHRVAMPHRIYTIKVNNGVVTKIYQHFVLEPPMSTSTAFLHAPFPNRHSSGDICRTGVMIAAQSEPMVFRLDHIVNQVERTRHNTDLISNAKTYMPDELSGGTGGMYTSMLRKWQTWTEAHTEDWKTALSELSWKVDCDIAGLMLRGRSGHG